MAMIRIHCPFCGTEIEIDGEKEFCFCGECGKKVTLWETNDDKQGAAEESETAPEPEPETETKPEPETAETPAPEEAGEAAEAPESVPVPPPTGPAAELDALFRARRYEDAYRGYTQYLQAHPGDIRSLYRQGICAVYLSEGNIFRTAELRSAAGAAVNAMSKSGDQSLAPEKDEDILALLVYMTAHGVSFNDKLPDREACTSQVTGWIALAGLYLEAVPLITSEPKKEEALRAGVEFCDSALHFKMSYFTGTKQGSNGKTKEEYDGYSLEKKQRVTLKDARSRMAESYNTLGSRTTEETRLNTDASDTEKQIARLRTSIRRTKEKYKAARKVFLLEKPEVKAGSARILRNTLIIVGIVIVALGVFGFFALRNDKKFLFVLLMLLAAAFLVLGWKIGSKNILDYESGLYPPELKALFDKLTDDKKQLRASRKHASAARTALKKFNRSKL